MGIAFALEPGCKKKISLCSELAWCRRCESRGLSIHMIILCTSKDILAQPSLTHIDCSAQGTVLRSLDHVELNVEFLAVKYLKNGWNNTY